jgi:hypothetical protein
MKDIFKSCGPVRDVFLFMEGVGMGDEGRESNLFSSAWNTRTPPQSDLSVGVGGGGDLGGDARRVLVTG